MVDAHARDLGIAAREDVKELLLGLDQIARMTNPRTSGLPLWNNSALDQMVEEVLHWLERANA